MEQFELGSAAELTPADLQGARDRLLDQMRWTRQYSLQLIDTIPVDIWYEQPAGAQTHVAWQVGHLAVSQYGLMLFRQRGRQQGDLDIMPGWLRRQFGRGTSPKPKSENSPAPDELLHRLSKIHDQAMREVSELPSEVLAEPTEMPYAAYPIKLGALLFCPIHESLHAGQIGLLRRLHGLDPIR